MSPVRYRPSYEARPVFDGLPRTDVNTPGSVIGVGILTLSMGGLAVLGTSGAPSGSLTEGTLTLYRVGGWAGIVLGVALIVAAFLMGARRAALARARSAGSPDAWKYDHPWTPGQCRDRALDAALESTVWLVFAVILGSAGAPLLWIMSASEATPFGKLVALFVGGTAALVAYSAAGTAMHGYRFGESFLRWEGDGPLRAGSNWTGTIALVDAIAAPYAYLQFVREYRFSYNGENVAYGRREYDRVDLAATLEPRAGGGKLLRLSAAIPAAAPATELSTRPACYWELRVADDASGWATSFLVPLYR